MHVYTQKQKSGGGGVGAAPAAASKPAGGNANVDVAQAMAWKPRQCKFTYTQKDAALYALSVGVAKNPLCDKQLPFVYENAAEFKVRGCSCSFFGTCCGGNVVELRACECEQD